MFEIPTNDQLSLFVNWFFTNRPLADVWHICDQLSQPAAFDENIVDKQVGIVLNQHAGGGRRGAIQASRELITKGEEMQQIHGLWDNPFEANARW